MYIIPSSSIIENQIQLIHDSYIIVEIIIFGACSNQAEEEQLAMTTTEAITPIRLQLDNLQKEKQELHVRILKLN